MIYLIICSFSRHRVRARIPREMKDMKKKLVLCNYPLCDPLPENGWFRPYEARVYKMKKTI